MKLIALAAIALLCACENEFDIPGPPHFEEIHGTK